MADGYREAVRIAFGIDLAPVADVVLSEQIPAATVQDSPRRASTITPSPVDRDVARALRWLDIHDHDDTIRRAASAMVSLRLDRLRDERKMNETMSDTPPIRPELLEILACPACKARVRLEGDKLVCESCGRRYPIEDGIPIMLVDAAT